MLKTIACTIALVVIISAFLLQVSSTVRANRSTELANNVVRNAAVMQAQALDQINMTTAEILERMPMDTCRKGK